MMRAARMFFESKGNVEEEMYKELFVGLTGDTLPETVVIPSDVTKIGRQYWLASTTAKDITFLASDITAANNSVAYISTRLSKIRLPNITVYKSWGFVSNCYVSHLDLYIPKCRMFASATYLFDPPANKTIGIHIEEIPCSEIKSIPNFPGLHANNYSSATFYGSDGSITWNGSEWVISNSNGGGYKCIRFSPLSFSRSSRLWKEAA